MLLPIFSSTLPTLQSKYSSLCSSNLGCLTQDLKPGMASHRCQHYTSSSPTCFELESSPTKVKHINPFSGHGLFQSLAWGKPQSISFHKPHIHQESNRTTPNYTSGLQNIQCERHYLQQGSCTELPIHYEYCLACAADCCSAGRGSPRTGPLYNRSNLLAASALYCALRQELHPPLQVTEVTAGKGVTPLHIQGCW